MTRFCVAVLMAVSFGVVEGHAQTFPSTEQFMNMFNLCSGGGISRLEANIERSVEEAYERERAEGTLDLRNESEYLELFPEEVRDEVAKLYYECIKDLFDKFYSTPPSGNTEIDDHMELGAARITNRAKFSEWPVILNNYGRVGPSGSDRPSYLLRPRSNTWIYTTFVDIKPLGGDFSLEFGLRMSPGNDCSILSQLADKGNDYALLSFIITRWNASSYVYSINEYWMVDGEYAPPPRREIANRAPVGDDAMKALADDALIIAITRVGGEVGLLMNGVLLMRFNTPVFDIQRVRFAAAHPCIIRLHSFATREPV